MVVRKVGSRTLNEGLAHLGQHPGWVLVEDEIKRFNAKRRDSLAVRQMSGQHVPQERWEYERGILMGMVMLHRLIKGEADKLQKELDEGKAE